MSLFCSCVSKCERFEFGNALIEILDHFAQPVSQSCIFVDMNFLGLVLEEVLHSWNVDFPAPFVLLFNLRHVESETFEAAGRSGVIECNAVES